MSRSSTPSLPATVPESNRDSDWESDRTSFGHESDHSPGSDRYFVPPTSPMLDLFPSASRDATAASPPSCGGSAQPAIGPPSRSPLDHNSYPHILDRVITYASCQALAALRSTSRTMQQRVEPELYRHVVVAPVKLQAADVQFLAPDGSRLPGLACRTSREQEITAERLRNTRILDIVRHPFDTYALGRRSSKLRVAPEWWMWNINADIVRHAGSTSLWSKYRDDIPSWRNSYYSKFARWVSPAAIRNVSPQPAPHAISFTELIPPHPAYMYVDRPRTRRNAYSRSVRHPLSVMHVPAAGATSMTINVRYEPGHPLLPSAIWHDVCGPWGEWYPLERATVILTPTGQMNCGDGSSDAARMTQPVGLDFEEQCAEFLSRFGATPDGIVWSLHSLAARARGSDLTIVGLELLNNAALSFQAPNSNFSWEARKAELEARFRRVGALFQAFHDGSATLNGVSGLSATRTVFPRLLTIAEYRAEVGERMWQLEISEPLGPWSTPVPSL